MLVYLPIAEMTVNVMVIVGVGGLVGILAGLFGVGGGFLLTPLLIFLGVPPPVAVATGANQFVASAVAGVLSHWRRGNVDVRMGLLLVGGGMVGSAIGVLLFRVLQEVGQIDVVIRLSYVLLLGSIGSLILWESVAAMRQRDPDAAPPKRGPARYPWMTKLPLKTRFLRSKLYVSALVPALIGFLVGILSAMLGVGGGFIMVPAMIYLLGMPAQTVVGTSLFQVLFVTALTTFLQATLNQTVDVILALMLIVGGVLGTQLGTFLGQRLAASRLRALLAFVLLGVCLELMIELLLPPEEPFSMVVEGLP